MSRPKLGALAILAHTLIGFFFGVTAYFILDTFRLSYVVQTTPVPWLVTGVLGTLLYLSMHLVLSYAPPRLRLTSRTPPGALDGHAISTIPGAIQPSVMLNCSTIQGVDDVPR